jgi:hypothetical protein
MHFCTPVSEYKHSDSGFRYGMTHILELLQNIIPLLVREQVLVTTSIAIIARVRFLSH